jgi:hypothetical protein
VRAGGGNSETGSAHRPTAAGWGGGERPALAGRRRLGLGRCGNLEYGAVLPRCVSIGGPAYPDGRCGATLPLCS